MSKQVEYFDPKTNKFPYTELTDKHYLQVKKNNGLVFDENYPYIDNRINEYPTSLVYDEFKQFKEVKNKMSDNNADNILIVLSHLFGLNYKISYVLVDEKQYIDKIIDSLAHIHYKQM